jgi:hypothetical protein
MRHQWFLQKIKKGQNLRTPNSWKDSNASPKMKTTKEKKVGARSLTRKNFEGKRGALEFWDEN